MAGTIRTRNDLNIVGADMDVLLLPPPIATTGDLYFTGGGTATGGIIGHREETAIHGQVIVTGEGGAGDSCVLNLPTNCTVHSTKCRPP